MAEPDSPARNAAASGRVLLGRILFSRTFQRAILVLVVSVLCAFFMLEVARAPVTRLQVGDIAPYDVRATQSYEVVDEDATQHHREEASRAILPQYDFKEGSIQQVKLRLARSFALGRGWIESIESEPPPSLPGTAKPESGRNDQVRGEAEARPQFSDSPVVPEALRLLEAPERRQAFSEALGVTLTDDVYLHLVASRFFPEVEEALLQILTQVFKQPILNDFDSIPKDLLLTGIRIVSSEEGARRERVLYDRLQLLSLESARQRVQSLVEEQLGNLPPSQRELITQLGSLLVIPTLEPNPQQTEALRKHAADSVPPVRIRIKKGTMIIRRGDPVDERRAMLLDGIYRAREDLSIGKVLFSKALLIFILLTTTGVFATVYIRKFASELKDLLTLSILLTVIVGLVRVSVEVSNALAAYIPFVPLSGYYFAIPLACGAMVVRILMSSETALIFSIVAGCLAAMMMDYNGFFLAYFFVSSLAAAGGIAHTRERVHVLRGGLVAAAANVATVLSIELIRSNLADSQLEVTEATLTLNLSFAFVGGILSSILTLGMVPFFEILGYVTDYKLLELANLNHPLLKDLMVRAPGTYHHSIIVGNLSEAAAQAIKANALLARVGCLYHDIGKMKKPEYFIENLRNVSENRHDHMPAHMSALIIASHVREGIELGRKHRLPQAIIDLIPGHHGTSLISFFYNKARQEAGSGDLINENDFRYPGPRPRTREAGIVMLADATEASTRSIKNVNPARIRMNLQKIFQRVTNDGQLDECPLTLKDLSVVLESFYTTLMGIYHNRIEYPPEVQSGAALAGLGTGAVLTGDHEARISIPFEAPLTMGSAPLKVLPAKPGPDLLAATTTLDPLPIPTPLKPGASARSPEVKTTDPAHQGITAPALSAASPARQNPNEVTTLEFGPEKRVPASVPRQDGGDSESSRPQTEPRRSTNS